MSVIALYDLRFNYSMIFIMDENCFSCDILLADSNVVMVEHGLETLTTVSIDRIIEIHLHQVTIKLIRI